MEKPGEHSTSRYEHVLQMSGWNCGKEAHLLCHAGNQPTNQSSEERRRNQAFFLKELTHDIEMARHLHEVGNPLKNVSRSYSIISGNCSTLCSIASNTLSEIIGNYLRNFQSCPYHERNFFQGCRYPPTPYEKLLRELPIPSGT